MHTNTATEYRNLPLDVLTESATNPRRIFEDAALRELAGSIRSQGVLSPLLVRPLTDQSFEIVAGARRVPSRADCGGSYRTRPDRQPYRCPSAGGAVNREPATSGRSPDGGGPRLRSPAQPGGTEVQH